MRIFANCSTFMLLSAAAAMPVLALSSLSASAALAVSSTATQNMSCSHGLCVPTAKDAVLNVDDLTAMLARGNVEVSTGSGTLASEVEDILVVSGFSWSSKHSLELDAYRSISFQAGAVAVNGKGAVALVTNDGATDGQLSFQPGANLSFTSTANSLTINGAAYTLVNSIATLASAIAANPSGNFALANSYDASQDGTYHSSPIDTVLQGEVEGLGNTISNISIIAAPTTAPPKNPYTIGLFSRTESATIADLKLTNLRYRVPTRDSWVGGLVGGNGGLLVNDSASGSISVAQNGAGGLVGFNNTAISSSHASVSIRSLGSTAAGGLVGANAATVTLSNADGSVLGAQTGGGLVGMSSGSINECFASGRVASDDASGDSLGGLVGHDGSHTQNSYSTGSVSGSVGSFGGLIGSSQEGSYLNSYSAGLVPQNGFGFIGYGYAVQMKSSYWNTTTSKADYGTGTDPTGLTGLTSKQLRSGLPGGFDPAIWRETKGINHGFPYLINNLPTKE